MGPGKTGLGRLHQPAACRLGGPNSLATQTTVPCQREMRFPGSPVLHGELLPYKMPGNEGKLLFHSAGIRTSRQGDRSREQGSGIRKQGTREGAADSRQQTASSRQPTANSKQSTADSKQPTAESRQQRPRMGSLRRVGNSQSMRRRSVACGGDSDGHGVERERAQQVAAHALFDLHQRAGSTVDPVNCETFSQARQLAG